jgi:hypothetical protein
MYKSIDIVDEASYDKLKYQNIYNVSFCGGLKFISYIQDILIKIFKNFKGIFQKDCRLPNVCKDIAGHSSRAISDMNCLRSEAGIVGSNPTQGINVRCVYAFILCLCCPVFR